MAARELPGGLRLARATGALERLRGLAGLGGLGPADALELPGCRSVHTLGMRFALDLVWLDGAGAVVRIDSCVAPRRLRACRRARSVVETAAGCGRSWARALHCAPPPE